MDLPRAPMAQAASFSVRSAVGGSFLTDLQEHRASATPTSLWHEINEAMFNNSASLAFTRPKPSPNGSETMHIGSH